GRWRCAGRQGDSGRPGVGPWSGRRLMPTTCPPPPALPIPDQPSTPFPAAPVAGSATVAV
ncbi:MAG: hypothetical protein AVDCRST_MAG73-308, partial [uncultured Thermomicrobiales bacterium]